MMDATRKVLFNIFRYIGHDVKDIHNAQMRTYVEEYQSELKAENDRLKKESQPFPVQYQLLKQENQRLREELNEVTKAEEIMKTLDEDQVWSLLHSIVLSAQKALEE